MSRSPSKRNHRAIDDCAAGAGGRCVDAVPYCKTTGESRKTQSAYLRWPSPSPLSSIESEAT